MIKKPGIRERDFDKRASAFKNLLCTGAQAFARMPYLLKNKKTSWRMNCQGVFFQLVSQVLQCF